uniref:USP domain-containing protein n=1 Tax=Brassica oleracea var. oleracea TaxID=109376 RepID=A0A0D3BHY7_BRAOL
MGQKKKPPAPRSKQSLSSSAAEAEPSSEVSACTSYDGDEPSNLAEIKVECEKALTSFRRGSYNKAIRLMKESCSRHQHSALIHRVQGTVCVKVSSVYEDAVTKQKYIRSAIESARKAVELSPNSIEFAHFYANLLYEAASDGREYEEVLQECHRALSIENPIDPAKDSLQDESQHKILTPEARIANVQDELRSLIQKSNLGSLSTWMKHLRNGEGEFRLFDMRKMAEDPIESNLVQTRRPNEIKKATKTLEERRKEIEVRVAAGRLLQQKSESSSVDSVNSKGSDPALGSGQRSVERRKHGNARKNDSTVERRDRVRSYWESTGKEMKKELLRIKVSDLKSHFSASKDGDANDIITEALSFCEANKTWRFWVCCKCSEKFKDSESYMQHIVGEHIGNVLPKMQMVLPQSLDSERIEMLLTSPWKPLDFPAAVKLRCSQQKIQNTEFNEFYAEDYMDDGDDCFQDAWNDTSPEKEKIGDACNGYEKNESEKGRLPNPFYLPDEWPISDDPEHTYQGGRNMTSCLRTPLEVNSHKISDSTKESPTSTEVGIFGTGLQNEVGEYNCFLNVIIQSLWNLGVFRAEFLRSSMLDHHHVGDPCVVCSLYEVLTALSAASREIRKEPVTPSTLRIALSNLYPDSSFFQEAQMNDASEVLAVIFDCLHRSFAQSSSVSDTDSSESNYTGSWDCANRTCIAHTLFGMNIFEQLNCYNCELESRHMKYTSFFHNINASALRNMKVTCPETAFDELLNLVEMNHQLACDPETGGCGKPNHIRHFLNTPPHVFTAVLGWQNTCESVEDIAATLAALNTEIDISIMYRGLDPKSIYSLASVVCYYGQHYHCFAYSHQHDRWIMYDDKTVKVIGSWSDVLSTCKKGHLQPQLLLYEKQR